MSEYGEQNGVYRVMQPSDAEVMRKLKKVANDVANLDPIFKPPTREQDGFIATLGHFQIRKILDDGGFGQVVLAYDESRNEDVALKVLKAKYEQNEQVRDRFKHEAEQLGKIANQHIVKSYGLYNAHEYGPRVLVMELIHGESLRDRLKTLPPLSPRDAATIVRDTASGLAAMHEKQLVHRDVKPDNIMIDEKRVVIIDFGLARQMDGEGQSHTQSDVLIGSPPYLSPEQIRGDTVDHRTDIYSLGLVLFEALTRRLPWVGSNQITTLTRVSEEAPFASSLNNKVSPQLDLICDKCVRKDPRNRYQTATQLVNDLEAFLKGRGGSRAQFELHGKKAARLMRKHPVAATIIAAFLLITSGTVAGFALHSAKMTAVAAAATRAAGLQHEAELRAYLSNAALALSQGDSPRALSYLDMCQELRDTWPWQHLRCRIDSSHCTINEYPGPVRCLSVSPNGRNIATCTDDKAIYLFDTTKGKLLRRLVGHTTAVTSVKFHPAGHPYLASASNDGCVKLWDYESGEQLNEWKEHRGAVTDLAFTHLAGFDEGYDLLWSAGEDGSLRRWDLSTRQPYGEPLRHGVSVVRLASVPAAKKVYSLGLNGLLKTWSHAGPAADDLPPLFTRPNPKGDLLLAAVEIAPLVARQDSPVKLLWVRTYPTGIFQAWSGEEGKAIESVLWQAHSARPSAIACLPNGSLLSGGEDGRVLLWDRANGATSQLRAAHNAKVTALSLCDYIDSSGMPRLLLVSADVSGIIKLTRWVDLPGQLNLAGRPDDWDQYPDEDLRGCRAVGGKDGEIRILQNGQELLVLTAGGIVHGVRFSTDGKLIAEVETPEGKTEWRAWLTKPEEEANPK